ncbi:DNA polymerase III subunit epsilon [Pokkaliibacter plantistimulans]|uniref:DNA polymerase III subunit epsilon n=1 Tax=Pokkaliibacter plantistimulans TaxID=1635171 RepID=A0ABX5LYL4_9GAMM|nr:DNA polymerase III subunit epsilon [Pokkaliibacter plantistimulans]PXF31781.1 DNA polymerase III subunit epsilon [Pokkaliibacter plantistimulans]
MRQIILDTETTGIDPLQGHRLVEIGCVELVDRKHTGRHFHVYINPEREVDPEAVAVHGITDEFLIDKPKFAAVVDDFLAFVTGAELIIHNAPFDVGFLNHELKMYNPALQRIDEICTITDTLAMARKMYPGQKNNLDALCRRLGVDNSGRTLHGALLDSEILADVYLLMTGGQTSLMLAGEGEGEDDAGIIRRVVRKAAIPVLQPTEAEMASHRQFLGKMGVDENAW